MLIVINWFFKLCRYIYLLSNFLWVSFWQPMLRTWEVVGPWNGDRYYVAWREVRMFLERRVYGYDSSDMWCLRTTFAEFVLPRLKHFRVHTNSYPMDFHGEGNGGYEAWDATLDKMIHAFDLLLQDDKRVIETEEWVEVNAGLDLFRKYYLDLWS